MFSQYVSALCVVLIFIVSGQFFVMPWENSELPKLENPRLIVKKEKRIADF